MGKLDETAGDIQQPGGENQLAMDGHRAHRGTRGSQVGTMVLNMNLFMDAINEDEGILKRDPVL